MTQKEFNAWKKNGNLTLGTIEDYESLSNDLSEGMFITKDNLQQLAMYLSLERTMFCSKLGSLKCRLVGAILKEEIE